MLTASERGMSESWRFKSSSRSVSFFPWECVAEGSMKGFSGVRGAEPHPETAAGEAGKSVPSGLRPKSTTLAQRFSESIFDDRRKGKLTWSDKNEWIYFSARALIWPLILSPLPPSSVALWSSSQGWHPQDPRYEPIAGICWLLSAACSWAMSWSAIWKSPAERRQSRLSRTMPCTRWRRESADCIPGPPHRSSQTSNIARCRASNSHHRRQNGDRVLAAQHSHQAYSV